MNRTRFAVGWIAAVVLGFGLSAAQAERTRADPMKLMSVKLDPREIAALRLNNKEAEDIRQSVLQSDTPTSFWVVRQEFTDSFANVDKNLMAFMNEFQRQHLNTGLRSDPTALLLLQEDPGGRSVFKMSLGFRVNSALPARPPLKVEQVKYSWAVHYTHVGPYARLEDIYNGVFAHLAKVRAGALVVVVGSTVGWTPGWPVILELLSNPRMVPPANLRTKLIIPLF